MISKAQNLDHFGCTAGLCCLASGRPVLKMAMLNLKGPSYLLYHSRPWKHFKCKKRVLNVLMCCLVNCIFNQVYLDPHICLLMRTSKQFISVGHSWHCLSVLSAAKEREDVKSFGFSLRKILKLISSEGNTDDVVEVANILTTK